MGFSQTAGTFSSVVSGPSKNFAGPLCLDVEGLAMWWVCPIWLLVSRVPYRFAVNTGCRKEGTGGQDTGVLALASATDTGWETALWALVSPLTIKCGREP